MEIMYEVQSELTRSERQDLISDVIVTMIIFCTVFAIYILTVLTFLRLSYIVMEEDDEEEEEEEGRYYDVEKGYKNNL